MASLPPSDAGRSQGHAATPRLAVAQHLRAQYGFSVIPISRSSKRPALTRWGAFQTRPPRDEELRAWFATPLLHIAIVTGTVSGIVVVDCDDAEAQAWAETHLPPTPMRARSRRGVHLYFTHPGPPVANVIGAHPASAATRLRLDLKADRAYVRYYGSPEWPLSLDAVPVFDPAWLRTRPIPTALPRPAVASEVAMVDRARAYLRVLPIPVIGSGSDAATFYAACRLVRGFALSPADAEDLLWDWAGGRDGWTRDWVAEKVRNADRFGREPLGGLR